MERPRMARSQSANSMHSQSTGTSVNGTSRDSLHANRMSLKESINTMMNRSSVNSTSSDMGKQASVKPSARGSLAWKLQPRAAKSSLPCTPSNSPSHESFKGDLDIIPQSSAESVATLPQGRESEPSGDDSGGNPRSVGFMDNCRFGSEDDLGNGEEDDGSNPRNGHRNALQRYLSKGFTMQSIVAPTVEDIARDEQPMKGTFVDVAAMKDKVRQNLSKPPYSVKNFYKHKGLWQTIARHSWFDNASLFAVATNAVWIAIDTDKNKAAIATESDPIFQLAENVFCLFFFLEWTIRLMAFDSKRNCLQDGWFMFDAVLVWAMVLETWIMGGFLLLVGPAASGTGDTSFLRIARLMRLSRMARMARLFRVLPELMIMIRGMVAATRSVFFTLCLLLVVLYVFSIAFTQVLQETELGEAYFDSVPASMITLLIYGTLLDNIGSLAMQLGNYSWMVASMFFVFVLIAALTVMNMLIGVLCEVVNAVAATEKEEMLVTYVNAKLHKVLTLLDCDGGGTISKNEFQHILENADAVQCLQDVGVDVVGLVDFADYIFAGETLQNEEGEDVEQEMELGFEAFMDVVLQLRGTNNATVKDVVDLRKFVKQQLGDMNKTLTKIGVALGTDIVDTIGVKEFRERLTLTGVMEKSKSRSTFFGDRNSVASTRASHRWDASNRASLAGAPLRTSESAPPGAYQGFSPQHEHRGTVVSFSGRSLSKEDPQGRSSFDRLEPIAIGRPSSAGPTERRKRTSTDSTDSTGSYGEIYDATTGEGETQHTSRQSRTSQAASPRQSPAASVEPKPRNKFSTLGESLNQSLPGQDYKVTITDSVTSVDRHLHEQVGVVLQRIGDLEQHISDQLEQQSDFLDQLMRQQSGSVLEAFGQVMDAAWQSMGTRHGCGPPDEPPLMPSFVSTQKAPRAADDRLPPPQVPQSVRRPSGDPEPLGSDFSSVLPGRAPVDSAMDELPKEGSLYHSGSLH